MPRLIHVFCLCSMILAGLAGCVSPAKRARDHAAAFKKLGPADQRLVLRGRVRDGLDREAVIIAWGDPDQKSDAGLRGDGKEKTTAEIWTYRRQVTTHAAIGSYDQWQPGNLRAPSGSPLFGSPGFGFGGSGYEGWLLYSPHVQYTDSYIRRAAFVNGKLDSYQTWYGEFAPLP